MFGSRVHLVHLQLSRCFLELRLEKPLLFGVLRVQLLPLEGEAVLERSTRREVRRLLAKSEKKQNRVGGIRTQLNMHADFIYLLVIFVVLDEHVFRQTIFFVKMLHQLARDWTRRTERNHSARTLEF